MENLYYLNMHTESNPNGELRGQVSTLGDWICPSTDQLINQCESVTNVHVHVLVVNGNSR